MDFSPRGRPAPPRTFAEERRDLGFPDAALRYGEGEVVDLAARGFDLYSVEIKKQQRVHRAHPLVAIHKGGFCTSWKRYAAAISRAASCPTAGSATPEQ